MFETYRMLGRDREDELLREARRLQELGPSPVRLVLVTALAAGRRHVRRRKGQCVAGVHRLVTLIGASN